MVCSSGVSRKNRRTGTVINRNGRAIDMFGLVKRYDGTHSFLCWSVFNATPLNNSLQPTVLSRILLVGASCLWRSGSCWVSLRKPHGG